MKEQKMKHAIEKPVATGLKLGFALTLGAALGGITAGVVQIVLMYVLR